jgi:TnpA family transposase
MHDIPLPYHVTPRNFMLSYKGIESLIGRPIRVDVIREHWDEIIRLAASIRAGTVAPPP